jgi:hypothetical protein
MPNISRRRVIVAVRWCWAAAVGAGFGAVGPRKRARHGLGYFGAVVFAGMALYVHALFAAGS